MIDPLPTLRATRSSAGRRIGRSGDPDRGPSQEDAPERTATRGRKGAVLPGYVRESALREDPDAKRLRNRCLPVLAVLGPMTGPGRKRPQLVQIGEEPDGPRRGPIRSRRGGA